MFRKLSFEVLVLLLGSAAFPVRAPLLAQDMAKDDNPSLTRPDTEESELFRIAGNLFKEKKYNLAAKNYRDFMKRFPKDLRAPDAQMMLAECLYRQALLESPDAPSERALSEAAREFSGAQHAAERGDWLSESADLRAAEIDFDLKRYDAALRNLDRFPSEYPGGFLRGEARLLEAQALLATNQPAQAAKLLRSALREQPFYEDEPRMGLYYGIALFEIGDSSDALTYLNRIKGPAADLYAARALLSLGRPLLAVEKLKAIPPLDPDGPYVEMSHYLVGEAFYKAKDPISAQEAFEYFLRRYSTSPYRPAAMYKIGLCQFDKQDYLAARGSFQSVLQLAPKNEFAELSLYMTAETYLQEGRFKEAAFAYSDMAQTYSGPLAGNALFKLGWAHYKLGEYPSAESALKSMQSQYPGHPLGPAGAMLLGNTLTHQERFPEAVLAYQQALDSLQASAIPDEQKTDLREFCLALLNRANLLGKDYGRLVSGYQYVLNHLKPTLNPWRGATLLYIAEGYFRQGLYDQALGIYREIVNSYPVSPESALAVDGAAWCLFKKGLYAESERERQKIDAYRKRPAPAPSKTVLPEGQLPESLFLSNEFDTAASRFNQKKYLEALDAFEAFEKAHADSALAPEAALQAGWCYYRLEYYAQAIKAWERVETSYRDSPSAAKAAWSTADTYFRAGQYDKAVATYERILQSYSQDPNLNYARLRIAQSYYNAKDVLKAISAFEDLLTQIPDSPEASSVLDFLTQLLYRPDSKAQAAEALGKIADATKSPTLAAQARFRIAKSLYEAADYEAAAEALEKLFAGLAGTEEPADAQFYLAESYYNLKRYKDAATAYERFTVNYPGDSRYVPALFHLGTSRFQIKDFSGASDAFSIIVKQYPKTSYAPVALYNCALAYRKLGKWEEAAVSLTTYLKEYPEAAKTSNADGELISLYEENHQFAKAVEVILAHRGSLAKDDTQSLELSYRLAEDYASMGDDEKALVEYKTLAKNPQIHEPHRLSALAKLAEYYERHELWSEALRTYEDLARSSTRSDWAEAARTRAQLARDKVNQASAKGAPAQGSAKGSGAASSRKPKQADDQSQEKDDQ